ncbi:MAG TPA: hypothetical protein VF950_25805 [Planctomycetota bacterium]
MKRRGWLVLGGVLLVLGGTAAFLLRPRPPEPFPLAELVPADAVVYAGFSDVRRLAEIPGLEDLAARLEPARAHLSGPAAVYVDRHGDWVFLARLTRLAALVADAEVEDGAAVFASGPAALARHKERRKSILDVDTFRALGQTIFINLDLLRFHARRDFSAVGLELVGTNPLTLRGRALYRGDLFRLYVEQYLMAPRRTSDVPLGGVFIEPLPRLWDDVRLGLNPVDQDRLDRLTTGLARDFNDGRPWKDFLRKAGGAWGVDVRPGPGGLPTATAWLDLPDEDTKDRLARMLPKLTADVAKFHKDRGEPPPFELATEGGTWRVKVPGTAELRMGAALDPAYAFKGNRWILSTCAARLDVPDVAGDGQHLALAVDVPSALELAKACAPLIADGAFREEAELGAAALFGKAFTPETMGTLRRQFPEAADLRKFLDARRSEMRARALEEIAKSPKYAEELARVRKELDLWAGRLAKLGRVELRGRYGADGLELDVIAK